MPKLKPDIVIPDVTEDAAITRAARRDCGTSLELNFYVTEKELPGAVSVVRNAGRCTWQSQRLPVGGTPNRSLRGLAS